MASQDQLSLVCYCGLYCGLCAERNHIPKQAKMLLQSLQEGYDNWYGIPEDDDAQELIDVFRYRL